MALGTRRWRDARHGFPIEKAEVREGGNNRTDNVALSIKGDRHVEPLLGLRPGAVRIRKVRQGKRILVSEAEITVVDTDLDRAGENCVRADIEVNGR
jgi:hypothetical protein